MKHINTHVTHLYSHELLVGENVLCFEQVGHVLTNHNGRLQVVD